MEVDLNDLDLNIREDSNKDPHMTIGQKTKHHSLVVDDELVSFNYAVAYYHISGVNAGIHSQELNFR